MALYVDGELDMMCEGLFDNIEDLLDFSTDDESLPMIDGSDAAACHQIAPPPPPPVSAASVHPASAEGSRVTPTSEDSPKICDDINISEDWITKFLDDSNFDIDFPASNAAAFIAAAAPKKDYIVNVDTKLEEESLFQSFSPVSVLEEASNLNLEKLGGGSSSSSSSSSSSVSSGGSSSNETLCLAPVGPTMMMVPARARSKRPRRAAPAPAHVTVLIVPPATDGPPAVPTILPDCESFGESCPFPPPMRKKKKMKMHHMAAAGNAACGNEEGGGVRKCQHCGIQKTPQWRAGPMGPKTLCNACGVRYKSGRLFPEYRPAASPTFVPSVHSNSHKKVVEMRNKVCLQNETSGTPVYPAAKNCDLLAYIRRRE